MIISYTRTHQYFIDTKFLTEWEDIDPENVSMEEVKEILSNWTHHELTDICEDYGIYEEATTI